MATQLINGAMEMIHDQSLPTIELLQVSFPDNKDFMINVSTLFDPRYVFLIYAPILFALNKRVGHRTVMALTLTEWANQILKWLLAGERPYWYVHERANELANATFLDPKDFDQFSSGYAHLGGPHSLPELKQFPVTCELGAGSPSGHSMVTATVWYILIDAYLKGELQLLSKADYSTRSSLMGSSIDKLAKLTWSMYTVILVLVSLSRVYLACHFPHQCLCGAILGLVIARLVIERMPMDKLTRSHFCLATLGMFASAMGTYGLLRSLGVDPLWSVGKAMRWCIKKEYIHQDTTPFFSMLRYLGFCLGSGLAYDRFKGTSSEPSLDRSSSSHLLARRTLTAISSILFGHYLLALPVPKGNTQLFYAISFVLYTVFSYAIAGPIPALAKRALGGGAAETAGKKLRSQ